MPMQAVQYEQSPRLRMAIGVSTPRSRMPTRPTHPPIVRLCLCLTCCMCDCFFQLCTMLIGVERHESGHFACRSYFTFQAIGKIEENTLCARLSLHSSRDILIVQHGIQ